MKSGRILFHALVTLWLLCLPEVSQAQDRFAELSKAANQFAVAAYKGIAGNGGNGAISPYSLFTALAMAEHGARAATKTQMKAVMGTAAIADLAGAYAELLAELAKRDGAKGIELTTANSLWIGKEFKIDPAFVDTIRSKFLSEARAADFSGNPDGERRAINDWVAAKTHDRIANLIPAGGIGNLTNLVIVNAVYFYGKWDHAFDKSLTRDDEFAAGNGETRSVQFMRQEEDFLYFEDSAVQAVALPYSSGSLRMYIVLPKDTSGLAAFEKALTSDSLENIDKKMEIRAVKLALPKFKLDSFYEMSEVLKALGMTDAFDNERADFSGIDPARNIKISKAFHKVFVDVQEEGTEAAAATALIMVPMGYPPPRKEPVEFKANRPFLFYIKDTSTGVILFIGRVLAP